MMQAFVVSDRNHIFIEEERSVPFLVFIVKMIAKTTIRRTVERALAFPSSPELTALKIWMGTVFVLTGLMSSSIRFRFPHASSTTPACSIAILRESW